MRITGRIVDPNREPLEGAAVQAWGANRSVIAQGHTDRQGRFSLEGDGMIALYVLPPNWGGRSESVRFLPRVFRIPGVPRPLSTDVTIQLGEAALLPILAFDADGNKIGPWTQKHNRLLNPNHIGLFDLDEMPATGGFHWSQDDDSPTLLLPPGEPRVIQLLWTAPGYGRLICTADQRGRGFVAGDASDRPLFLNVELADTAWRRLLAEIRKCEDAGYTLSEEFCAQRSAAEAKIRAMEASVDPREKAAFADAALGAALSAGETLVMERARQRIARHRVKPFPVALQDEEGRPLSGAVVRYRQTAHAFRFGVFINPHTHPIQRVPLDSSSLWERVKGMGFNQLPLAILWPRVEPERGKRAEHAEYDIWPAHKLRAAGFTLKSHVAVWFWHGQYPDQWGVFTPSWAYELSLEEIKKAVYDHTKALMAKYYPHVTTWQAINEAMLFHTNALNLNLAQHVEVVGQVVRAIRETAPEVLIEVNSCQVFGEGIHPDVRKQGYERVPDEFYRSLLDHGVEFDAVGMQLYYGGYMDAGMWKGGFPVRHPWDLEAIIERYSRLGKPIYITEVSVPSSHPSPEREIDFGYWHGPWTPERQAEWVELFYTLCYSLPQVQEITWWNATDEAAFIKDGGLLYEDYTPKPAAKTLGRLTASWLRSGVSQADEKGIATLMGPEGDYALEVEVNGEPVASVTLHLGPASRRTAQVTVRSLPQAEAAAGQ